MGYLHEGHASLVDKAVSMCDRVVASDFVNPTQFGPNEDLESYPRDFDRDCALLEEHGCSMVFQSLGRGDVRAGRRDFRRDPVRYAGAAVR